MCLGCHQTGRQMAQSKVTVKEVIHDLCKILSVGGIYKISPEIFRLAKFNKDEATEPMWYLLYYLLAFLRNLTHRHEDISATYDIVLTAKSCYFSCGYRNPLFFLLPNDMTRGSQQLLLAFGWLAAKFEIVQSVITYRCTPVFDALSEMWTQVNTDADAKCPRKHLISNKVEKDLGVLESVNQLLFFSYKVETELKSCKLLFDGVAKQFPQIRDMTDSRNDHSNKNALGTAAMHLAVSINCKDNQSLIKTLEKERELLNFAIRWTDNEGIFWKWMMSVVDEKQTVSCFNETHFDLNNTSEVDLMHYVFLLNCNSFAKYLKQSRPPESTGDPTSNPRSIDYYLISFLTKVLSDLATCSQPTDKKHIEVTAGRDNFSSHLRRQLSLQRRNMDVTSQSYKETLRKLQEMFIEDTIVLPSPKR